jgi:hypothetical protein
MARDTEWRKKEPSLKDVQSRYPELPPYWLLKVDMQRRGIKYTDAAKDKVDPDRHEISILSLLDGKKGRGTPSGLVFKDGSTTIMEENDGGQRDPYIIDAIGDKIVIVDDGEILGEIEDYWEKPLFHNKKASNGEPFSKYVQHRPQRLDITLNSYCHFWDRPGEGCKYCSLSPNYKLSGKTSERSEIKYIKEAVAEALKQKGRYQYILLSGGSVLSGEKLFDDEVNGYIEILQAIGELFETKKFPSQVVCSAFDEEQMERLYNNTGIMNYTADIEVLNRDKFGWVCEGKNKYVGYDEWKRRLIKSVDIFGKGNVSSVVVLGVEQAKPEGFSSENDAYKAVLEEAEDLISHGVIVAANVWRAAPNSIFQNQDTPSLDFYAKTYLQLDKWHHQYGLNPYTDDYRHCGAHLGLDLQRI